MTPSRPFPAKPVLARLNAASLLLATLAQGAWLSLLIRHGYRWEIARCGRVPDQYYPEWAWLFLLFPLLLPLPLSAVGLLMAGRTGRWTWLVMSPGWLALAGVVWATWMSVSGCAIAFQR